MGQIQIAQAVPISIHALREEGDLSNVVRIVWSRLFLSTPSARRATPLIRLYNPENKISIHALREEGDWTITCLNLQILAFLSTPSARRATLNLQILANSQ